MKTYQEGKPLPWYICFKTKLFSRSYKNLDRLSDVTYELLSQDGSTIHVHRNHLIRYYPKEPPLYPHLRSFMRF